MRAGGARPPPLTIFTITYKVAMYALAERADTLTLSHLYQYMYVLCDCDQGDSSLPFLHFLMFMFWNYYVLKLLRLVKLR